MPSNDNAEGRLAWPDNEPAWDGHVHFSLARYDSRPRKESPSRRWVRFRHAVGSMRARQSNGLELSGPARARSDYRAAVAGSALASG